jgi:hypothetical protein
MGEPWVPPFLNDWQGFAVKNALLLKSAFDAPSR